MYWYFTDNKLTSARMLIYSLYMFYIPVRYNVKSVKNRTLVTQHSHLTSTEYDPNSAAAAEGGWRDRPPSKSVRTGEQSTTFIKLYTWINCSAQTQWLIKALLSLERYNASSYLHSLRHRRNWPLEKRPLALGEKALGPWRKEIILYRVSHPIVREILSCFVLGVPLPCLGSS